MELTDYNYGTMMVIGSVLLLHNAGYMSVPEPAEDY
jgi:hypothetical protein